MAGVSLLPESPGARREDGAYPKGSVTDEQRSPGAFWEPPEGPPFFSRPTSLLTPHPAILGLVARASRDTKIPRGETPAICETLHEKRRLRMGCRPRALTRRHRCRIVLRRVWGTRPTTPRDLLRPHPQGESSDSQQNARLPFWKGHFIALEPSSTAVSRLIPCDRIPKLPSAPSLEIAVHRPPFTLQFERQF